VVGVHVRLERELEAQAELLEQRRVATRLLEHRVDEQASRVAASASRYVYVEDCGSKSWRKIMRLLKICPLGAVVSSAVEHCSHTPLLIGEAYAGPKQHRAKRSPAASQATSQSRHIGPMAALHVHQHAAADQLQPVLRK